VPFFAWDDALGVGNTFIDNDHRQLIALLNKVNEAMYASKGRDVLGQVLGDLIVYTKEHFTREERVMLGIKYADFHAHKQEHEKLTAQVVALQHRFAVGETHITPDVLVFLFDWLFTHILLVDKKFAQAIEDDKIRTKITGV
jgi:hemerythrin